MQSLVRCIVTEAKIEGVKGGKRVNFYKKKWMIHTISPHAASANLTCFQKIDVITMCRFFTTRTSKMFNIKLY